jgi:hypothetical protein
MKVDRIIVCGNNGLGEELVEYPVPGNFTGQVTLHFGCGGFCGAWQDQRRPFEKKLDISANSVRIANQMG